MYTFRGPNHLRGDNSRRRLWQTVSVLVCGSILASCVALNASVRRGDELAEEGRWHEAMLEYEEAARSSPQNKAIQERLNNAKAIVALDLVQGVNASLEMRRLDRANQLLGDALSIHPEGAEVIDARRRVASAWAKEAEALLEEDGDLDRAVVAIERAARVDADGPGVRTTRNRVMAAYAAALRQEAESYREEGRVGAALAALVRLLQLERADPQARDQLTSLRAWMHNHAGYTAEVRAITAIPRQRGMANDILERILGLGPPEGCPNLQYSNRGGTPPGTWMSGQLGLSSFESRERTRTELHTYQSGTRTVPNPEWPRVNADVEAGQRELDRALEEVERLMEEVRRREVLVVESGPADDVASLRRDLQAARSNLEAAREDTRGASQNLGELQAVLNSTPETLEEPVMTDGELVITEVERSFRVEIVLDARDLSTGGLEWDKRLFAAESKTEAAHHRGLPEAGIAPNPLAFPLSDVELQGAALRAITSEIQDDIGKLCRAYRETLRQNGLSMAAIQDIPTATEWFVLGLFFDPVGDPDSWDTDGRVRRFFEQAWRIDDPMKIVGP